VYVQFFLPEYAPDSSQAIYVGTVAKPLYEFAWEAMLVSGMIHQPWLIFPVFDSFFATGADVHGNRNTAFWDNNLLQGHDGS